MRSLTWNSNSAISSFCFNSTHAWNMTSSCHDVINLDLQLSYLLILLWHYIWLKYDVINLDLQLCDLILPWQRASLKYDSRVIISLVSSTCTSSSAVFKLWASASSVYALSGDWYDVTLIMMLSSSNFSCANFFFWRQAQFNHDVTISPEAWRHSTTWPFRWLR